MVRGRIAGFGIRLGTVRQYARPSVDVVDVRLKRIVIFAVFKTFAGDHIAVL